MWYEKEVVLFWQTFEFDFFSHPRCQSVEVIRKHVHISQIKMSTDFEWKRFDRLCTINGHVLYWYEYWAWWWEKRCPYLQECVRNPHKNTKVNYYVIHLSGATAVIFVSFALMCSWKKSCWKRIRSKKLNSSMRYIYRFLILCLQHCIVSTYLLMWIYPILRKTKRRLQPATN